jgi:hypothetical protein
MAPAFGGERWRSGGSRSTRGVRTAKGYWNERCLTQCAMVVPRTPTSKVGASQYNPVVRLCHPRS